MNKKTKEMAYLAIFTALIILMTFVPFLGYITIGIFSITTIPLVVITGTIILGLKGGIWLSLMFGVFSLIRATMPGTIADPMFLNPLISIFPRLLFGVATYYIFRGMQIAKNDHLRYGLVYFLATLFHTIIVCVMFALVKPMWFIDTISAVSDIYPFINNIWMVVVMGFLINGALEAVIGTIIGPFIIKAYKNNLEVHND